MPCAEEANIEAKRLQDASTVKVDGADARDSARGAEVGPPTTVPLVPVTTAPLLTVSVPVVPGLVPTPMLGPVRVEFAPDTDTVPCPVDCPIVTEKTVLTTVPPLWITSVPVLLSPTTNPPVVSIPPFWIVSMPGPGVVPGRRVLKVPTVVVLAVAARVSITAPIPFGAVVGMLTSVPAVGIVVAGIGGSKKRSSCQLPTSNQLVEFTPVQPNICARANDVAASNAAATAVVVNKCLRIARPPACDNSLALDDLCFAIFSPNLRGEEAGACA
jgi:hypothetical protein